MIGSHNSLSYLPPQNLWGKITKLWGKCQDKTLKEQYDAGVRYFDIRIQLHINSNDDYEWHFVHNKVDYGKVNNWIWNWLGKYKCPIRIIFDQRSKPDYAEKRTKIFKGYIYIIKRDFNVVVDSAITYWDWKEHLNPTIEIKEYHASVSTPWYQYILGTKWFAKRYNKYAKETYYGYSEDIERVLLLDYVEYGTK